MTSEETHEEAYRIAYHLGLSYRLVETDALVAHSLSESVRVNDSVDGAARRLIAALLQDRERLARELAQRIEHSYTVRDNDFL